MSQITDRRAYWIAKEKENYEKGQRFEQYIINLFNEHFFKLKEWRKSDYYGNSSWPIDLWNPDIDMELVFTGARKYRFAVECKWRTEFYRKKIDWAKKRHIRSYLTFQRQTRIPVFVAIGIGGEPDNPCKLFLTPLNNIYMKTELYEKDLIPFERQPRHRFFYDVEQLRLF